MRPGEVIAGRFELTRSVRSGGLSIVFQAVDRLFELAERDIKVSQ